MLLSLSHLRRGKWLGPLLAAFLLFFAANAESQTPTPEGTTIESQATATFTDANDNTYDEVSDTHTFTVGHEAALTVTSPATVSPEAPSTGNQLDFEVANDGNGPDSVLVDPTVDSGITITGFDVGAESGLSESELNDYLADEEIASGDDLTITVNYDVDEELAGDEADLSVELTSRRDGSVSSQSTTSVEPPFNFDITVSDVTGDQDRLPTASASSYTHEFDVSNESGTSATFDLDVEPSSSGVLSVVSVDGSTGSTTQIELDSEESRQIEVEYEVEDVDRGATSDLELTATQDTDSEVTDSASPTITVIRPELSVTKEAFRDDQTTSISESDEVQPEEVFWYRVTISNDGDSDAEDVEVVDELSEYLNYQDHEADESGWTISVDGQEITAVLDEPLEEGVSRYFWIQVEVP